MQFLAGFALILTLAFSLMQCDKTKIPDSVSIVKANTNSPAATNTPEEAPRISLEAAKKEFERKYVTAAVTKASGNMGRAAKSLGIHRNTLRTKISLLKVKPPVRGRDHG